VPLLNKQVPHDPYAPVLMNYTVLLESNFLSCLSKHKLQYKHPV